MSEENFLTAKEAQQIAEYEYKLKEEEKSNDFWQKIQEAAEGGNCLKCFYNYEINDYILSLAQSLGYEVSHFKTYITISWEKGGVL